jgi:hypothetical protein
VPKICRLQANFVFFFQGSAAEVEIITEEYAPPMYTKNEFKLLVNEASSQTHTFLTINNKVGWDKRFRRNLDEFITLSKLTATETQVGAGGGGVEQKKCEEGKKCDSRSNIEPNEDTEAVDWLETSKKYVHKQPEWHR